MTLGVFVTSTVAWFDISNNLIVNELLIGMDDDKGIQIGLSKDGTFYKSLDSTILKEAGFDSGAGLHTVTSGFQKDWLNDSTDYKTAKPELHRGPVSQEVADSGFFQFELYALLPNDGYLYLDPSTTLVANEAENEKTARRYNMSTTYLNKAARCARVSFFSEDCGFTIYEPNETTPSKTALAGRLDFNPSDTYYDYNAGTRSEILYGDYQIDDDIGLSYGLALSDDTEQEGDWSCFNARTKAGIRPIDVETSVAKGGLTITHEDAKVLSDLVPPEDGQSLGNPIAYCPMGEPTRFIVTYYVEGWDLDCVQGVALASLDLKLVFTAVLRPKISN
jgi:hypothetical protein